MLSMTDLAYAQMVGLAYDGLPNEACGLLAGNPTTGKVTRFYPCRNAAESSRIYTIHHRDYMDAEDDADRQGISLMGVMHSHTHTDAYPSPTDVAQAIDPTWHYVIVSLRQDAPAMRSYRIDGESVEEEAVGRVAR